MAKVPPFWKDSTANGIRIIGAYNSELPTVFLSVSIKGGALLVAEDPSKAGLPNIAAQMLNDETTKYTAEQMNAQLEQLGSIIQVGAATDATVFYGSTLTKNLDETLSLLQERLFHPKFTQEALDRIKKQTLQNFQIAKTQPANVAGSVFNKVLYGKNNVRTYALLGNEKTVPHIALADVQAYYD